MREHMASLAGLPHALFGAVSASDGISHLAIRLRFWAVAAIKNSARAPLRPRSRRRSSFMMRLRWANSISTFLRSLRDCLHSVVCAMDRATSRAPSWMLRAILRNGVFGQRPAQDAYSLAILVDLESIAALSKQLYYFDDKVSKALAQLGTFEALTAVVVFMAKAEASPPSSAGADGVLRPTLACSRRSFIPGLANDDGWNAARMQKKMKASCSCARCHCTDCQEVVCRYLAGGEAALVEAPSRPLRSPKAINAGKPLLIVELRKRRMLRARIARSVGVSKSTVSRVLARAGISKLSDLEPVEPIVRYEHKAPGNLLHIDTKERPSHRAFGISVY